MPLLLAAAVVVAVVVIQPLYPAARDAEMELVMGVNEEEDGTMWCTTV